LNRFMDKQLKIKFNGGREGSCLANDRDPKAS
jgi:hypothetical protein